jgi:periplasmic copper chaperone A
MKWIATALLVLVSASAPLSAQEFKSGSITVRQPWSPAPPNAAQAAGGYLVVTNHGPTPDTLTGGSIDLAGRVEVHEMAMDGGIMRMRELKPGLVIKPGETVTLQPGGLHLMFMGLKQQPTAGSKVKGTLVFEKAGTIAVEFQIEPFGTRKLGDGGAAAKGKAKGGGSGSGSESGKGSGSGSGSR